MKKAIVIGATSGIGKSITEVLIQNDYAVGVTGRRLEMLKSLTKIRSIRKKVQSNAYKKQ